MAELQFIDSDLYTDASRKADAFRLSQTQAQQAVEKQKQDMDFAQKANPYKLQTMGYETALAGTNAQTAAAKAPYAGPEAAANLQATRASTANSEMQKFVNEAALLGKGDPASLRAAKLSDPAIPDALLQDAELRAHVANAAAVGKETYANQPDAFVEYMKKSISDAVTKRQQGGQANAPGAAYQVPGAPAPAAGGKPEWKEVGTDPATGQKTYAFVNPVTQTVTQPAGAPTAPAAPAAPLTGDEYLKTLTPAAAARVKAVVEGREAPPPGGSRAPQAQALLNMAAQYEPGFDFTKWTQRNATSRDFASGKSAEMVRSANQTLDHVGHLMESVDALHNKSMPAYNAVANYLDAQTGGAAPNNALLNAHAVADEMSKVFKGGNLSDAEIRSWESGLSVNMSPEQWHGAIAKLMSLLNGSLSALDDKRSRGMSTSNELPPLLNQRSQDVMNRVSQWVRGGQSAGSIVPGGGQIMDGGAGTGQGAPAAAPQAAAPTSQPAPPAPQEAVDFLRANPALAPHFDEKYGPGSAARVLGSGA